MSDIDYAIGDERPNLGGEVKWPGSVKTDTITATLKANGNDAGPFTGVVVIESYVSENATESSIVWSYDVQEDDTLIAGEYELCLVVTHDTLEPETVKHTKIVKVEACA